MLGGMVFDIVSRGQRLCGVRGGGCVLMLPSVMHGDLVREFVEKSSATMIKRFLDFLRQWERIGIPKKE
jgi:hypothetical protein